MFLTPDQRIALMETVALRHGVVSRIAAIDAVVAQLRQQNPDAFHTSLSLAQRVFFHEPDSDIPYLAAIKPQALSSRRKDDSAG